MPKQEISPRGNDANHVLRSLLLLVYYGLHIFASQANAMNSAHLKAWSLEQISNITEHKAMLRAFQKIAKTGL